MDELRLAIPDESLLDEIAAYRQAMLDADSSMDGCGPLKRMENPAEWLAFCRQLDDPVYAKEGTLEEKLTEIFDKHW